MSYTYDNNYHFETIQLHAGQENPDPATDARAVPIYQTTSFVFKNSAHAAARFALADAGNIYGRLTNSTVDAFEQRIAALEGGVAALGVASGAAAINYTFLNLASAGDNIVSAKTIYGGTYNLLEHTLPQYGITATFVDPDEEGAFENAINDKTKAVFIETIGNPNATLIDIEKDVGAAAFVTKIRAILLRDTGATLAPLHAFLFLQGLETLSLRVERHVENALKVVDFLSKHPKVESVNHPSLPDSPYHELYKKYFPNGGASIFTFNIKGGAKEAQAFIDRLKIFSLLANVADVKSLVIHPASTTHSQLNEEELAEQGIQPNTIRLSIGTEHIDDIIADLSQAFGD